MKTAIISPIPLLEKYATLSDSYHLVLTHLILQEPEYVSFYKKLSRQGHYIILDNSAHEFGNSFKIEQLERAAKLVEPSEITLPDRLFFGDDTYRQSKEAISILRKTFPTVKFMGVPQGRHVEEFMECLQNLSLLGIDTVGLSKDYEVWEGGLVGLVKRIHSVCPRRDIHLLGWGRDLKQLWTLSRLKGYNIRGIDSAKPLVYASCGIRLDLNDAEYPGRTEEFFYLKDIDDDLARDNIKYFQFLARGKFYEYV